MFTYNTGRVHPPAGAHLNRISVHTVAAHPVLYAKNKLTFTTLLKIGDKLMDLYMKVGSN
jgi:hypothetical protein